jgi:hypothetical protein
MKRTTAVSMFHGNSLSVQFDDTVALESKWHVGVQAPLDPEDTRPWDTRVRLPLVADLLLQALDVEPGIDYAFMPYPKTCLREAIKHLSLQGSIGIAGGIIYWNEQHSVFTCVALGSSEPPAVLLWLEVADLLKANYKEP